MKLYLLINDFKYPYLTEVPDRVGIFDSLEAAEKAKEDYMKSIPNVPRDIFRFYIEEFELNKIIN